MKRVLDALRARSIATLAVGGLALAATACVDSTEPAPLVEGRAAHAITGGADALVLIDFVPQFQLQPLQFAYFFTSGTLHTYEFVQLQDTLSLEIEHTRDITAVILLDLGEPVLRAYGIDRDPTEQRLAVINAHGAAGDLDVTLESGTSSFSLTLPPGEVEQLDPPAGAFSVRVRGADDPQGFDLDPFTLSVGDHGFLVLVAGPTPATPYAWLLF